MHRAVITQLLKQGAAVMSRKQRDSTSYSDAFEVRLCLVLFAMSRTVVSAGGELQDMDQDKKGND